MNLNSSFYISNIGSYTELHNSINPNLQWELFNYKMRTSEDKILGMTNPLPSYALAKLPEEILTVIQSVSESVFFFFFFFVIKAFISWKQNVRCQMITMSLWCFSSEIKM